MLGMRTLLTVLTLIAWSLWFGGMIALILFVSMLFAKHRGTAIEAAPVLFVGFGTYQLIVAAVAIAAAAAWRMIEKRREISRIIILFVLAAIGAVLLATVTVPRMEKLRAEGQRESPQFQALHKQSTKLYSAEAIALLVAGWLLPGALRLKPEPAVAETVPGIAQASIPPDAAEDSATAT